MTKKAKLQSWTIRTLLALLNSRLLNQSPCEYGYINNVDAFTTSFLRSEVAYNADITVKQILADAEMFKCCPMRDIGLTVIQDGEHREADVWDIHQLREQFTRAAAPTEREP